MSINALGLIDGEQASDKASIRSAGAVVAKRSSSGGTSYFAQVNPAKTRGMYPGAFRRIFGSTNRLSSV